VVNISKYCIRCAYIDTPVDKLKLQNQFVASFKGFKEYTTASEAMRTMRLYNGRTCYFHGRIAYIAFASEEDMLNACKIRISHNEYLLDGRPRRLNRSYTPQHVSSTMTTQPKNSSYKNSFTSNSQQSAARRYVDNNFTDPSPSSISQKGKDRVLPSPDLKDNTDSLTLILSKLQELDSIKEHLAKLDSQMISFANLNGPLA